MSRRPAIYPLPEAVKRKRYEVVEGRGHCDNKNSVMAVPLDGSPASRRVIAHETAHARWSPRILKRPKSIPENAVQRAEDLRMNLLTVRMGAGDALLPPLADNEPTSVEAFYAGFCGNRHSVYTAALALVNTGDYERFIQVAMAINPVYALEALEVAASAWAAMDAIETPEWEDTLKLAKKVTELAHERNEAEREEQPEDPAGDTPDEDGDDPEGEEVTFEPPPPIDGEDGEAQGEAGDEQEESEESAGGGGITEEDEDDADEDDEGDTESSGSDGGEEDAEDSEDEDKAGVGDTEAEEESAPSEGGGADGGKAGDSDKAEDGESESDEDESGESEDGDEESDGDGDPEGSGEVDDMGDASTSEEYDDEVDPLDLDDIELDDDEATEKMSTHDGFMDAARAIPEEKVDDVEAAVQDMLARCSSWRSGPGPGIMSIVTPPRVKRLPARLIGKGRSAATEGTAPRWMNRYCTDGAIFGGRAKRPGTGTVVFDTSGSMSLSAEDVQDLMEKLPAGTIAAYAGEGHYGQLRILAKDGRRVDDSDVDVPGYGNIVDLPALEWLAKQAEPRLWVCDGIVTGKDDNASRGVLNACARVCREAKILRLPSLRDLELWLERAKKVDKKRGGR